jgi:predicted PurR-regulated permease PerM
MRYRIRVLREYVVNIPWLMWIQVGDIVAAIGILAALVSMGIAMTITQARASSDNLPSAVVQDRLLENRQRLERLENWRDNYVQQENQTITNMSVMLARQQDRLDRVDNSLHEVIALMVFVAVGALTQIGHTIYRLNIDRKAKSG